MVVQPSIADILGVVYRRKWSIGLVSALVLGLGAAYLITAVPQYRSTASLVVRFGGSAVPVTNLARDAAATVIDSAERRELIQAHSDLLTSPDMAEAIINKIGLARLYPAIAAQPPAIGTPMDAAIKRFNADLFVSPEVVGTVIRFGFTSPDPVLAKATLDALIDEYMRRESEIFSDSNFAFKKAQAGQAYATLIATQQALSAYKAKAGISDFETQMNALIQQQSELKGRLHVAEVALAEATQRKSALAALLTNVAVAVTNTSSDKFRQVDEAQARLNELQARERELTASHGPDWPAARTLRASIAEAQSTMAAMTAASANRRQSTQSSVYSNLQTDLLRVSAEAESGAQAVSLVTTQLGEVGKRITALEAERAGLQERQRNLELADSTYRSIAMSLEDSRITADRLKDGISRIAVITEPDLPLVPTSPRYKLLSLFIALAAAMAGLVVGFTRELMDDRFVSAKQVAGRLKVPVLATFDKV